MQRGLNIRALGAFFALMYFIQSLGDPSSGIVSQPLRSMLDRWGEDPARIALFMGLVGLPWGIKPLFGLLSDFVPIMGSKRRIYLIVSTISACIGYAAVTGSTFVAGDFWVLLLALLLPAMGIAFGDVLIDAVMIDEGQPRGLTGVLQSVQWTAAYAGMLLTGVMGGYFSEIQRPDLAFGLCAILWSVSLLLAILVVKERPEESQETFRGTLSALAGSVRRPGLVSVCVILFVWNFNPLWTTVLYLHFTKTLGFDELTFGRTISVFSFGCMLASLAYPAYCRRFSVGLLIEVCILAGVAANIFYWFVWNEASAYTVALLGGFAYMTGTMIQLDIAARRVPLVAAATIFASMMALSNVATSISEAVGGEIYQLLMPDVQPSLAYNVVVGVSVLMPALCWLILPSIRRELPQWFEHTLVAQPAD